ncbi:MAG: hypothetical protein ABSC53_13380, partial [Bacteroidota bacterium]
MRQKSHISPILIVLLTIIVLIVVLGSTATATTITSNAATGNWNAPASWSPAQVPTSADDVIIATGNVITISATGAVCNSLTINAAATANGITFGGVFTLTVSGAIIMNAPSGAVNSTISVLTGTLSAASIAIPGSATAAHNCIVSVSTGTINVTGNITFSGTAAQAQLTFTGAGTLNIGGNLGTGGTFTKSTGIVNCNGSLAQTIAGYNYNTVKSNNTAGVTPVAAPTITTLTIADVTANSVFNDGGFTVATATTLNLNTGTYNCTAAALPWGTISANTGTVNYALAGTQTIATSAAYYNLTISGASGTKTLGGASTCTNLTVNSGPTLALAAIALTVSGIVNNAGTITGTTGRIMQTGSSDFTNTSPGSITFTGAGSL